MGLYEARKLELEAIQAHSKTKKQANEIIKRWRSHLTAFTERQRFNKYVMQTLIAENYTACK